MFALARLQLPIHPTPTDSICDITAVKNYLKTRGVQIARRISYEILAIITV